MPTGYAKSWVDKFHDPWYLSLKLASRGMWDQMFTYAKLMGDTGNIYVASMQEVGRIFGCDRRTADKIVKSMYRAKKIELDINVSGVHIFIKNYVYWQRVKKPGDGKNGTGATPHERQKCSTNQTRPDQRKKYPKGISSRKSKNSTAMGPPKIFTEKEIERIQAKIDAGKKLTKAEISGYNIYWAMRKK